MNWNWKHDTTEIERTMDTVDYDPDILKREANVREQMTARQEMPSLPPQPQENPQVTAINQMQIEAYWREVTLRANLIAMAKAQEHARA